MTACLNRYCTNFVGFNFGRYYRGVITFKSHLADLLFLPVHNPPVHNYIYNGLNSHPIEMIRLDLVKVENV